MLPHEIVEFIESELKRQHVSKMEFYKQTGVSAAVFSNWRSNKNRPSLDALDNVNKVLGTTFTISVDMPDAKSLTPDEYEIILAYRKANEYQKNIVRATLEPQLTAQSKVG